MTDESVLQTQRWMWSMGDYPAVARYLMPISLELLDAVGVAAGDRLLDVGVGDGNTAIEAARRGALVTGLDLTPEQVDKARKRAADEGVAIELREGNAEDLPYADGSFDTVVSVMGMIFAPDHEAAAREMARVCRAGGTVAITAWTDGGWYDAWRARAAQLVPELATGAGGPDAWGEPGELTRRLTAAGLTVEVEARTLNWAFGSSDEAADFFLTAAGPFIAFQHAAAAGGHGADEVRDVLLSAVAEANQATDGTCLVPAPYLLAVARRN